MAEDGHTEASRIIAGRADALNVGVPLRGEARTRGHDSQQARQHATRHRQRRHPHGDRIRRPLAVGGRPRGQIALRAGAVPREHVRREAHLPLGAAVRGFDPAHAAGEGFDRGQADPRRLAAQVVRERQRRGAVERQPDAAVADGRHHGGAAGHKLHLQRSLIAAIGVQAGVVARLRDGCGDVAALGVVKARHLREASQRLTDGQYVLGSTGELQLDSCVTLDCDHRHDPITTSAYRRLASLALAHPSRPALRRCLPVLADMGNAPQARRTGASPSRETVTRGAAITVGS